MKVSTIASAIKASSMVLEFVVVPVLAGLTAPVITELPEAEASGSLAFSLVSSFNCGLRLDC